MLDPDSLLDDLPSDEDKEVCEHRGFRGLRSFRGFGRRSPFGCRRAAAPKEDDLDDDDGHGHGFAYDHRAASAVDADEHGFAFDDERRGVACDGRPYVTLQGESMGFSEKEVRATRRGLAGEEKMRFVTEFGRVRHADVCSPIACLSECGDERCGAHRLKQPHVRARFRSFIVKAVREAVQKAAPWWGPEGLRYASLGSGKLLFDAELLERLRSAGARVAQICLVDTDYAKPDEETTLALKRFADWQASVCRLEKAAPPEVLAFRSAEDYFKNALPGGVAAGCHLFVHCDAYWDGCEQDCRRLAERALAPGGLLARLANLGSREVASEMMEQGPEVLRRYWKEQLEHSDAPFAAEAFRMQEDGDLDPVEDPLLGEDSDTKMQRECEASERLKHAERQRGEELGYEVWKVVKAPHVKVFTEPYLDSEEVGTVLLGAELVASRRKGDWIKVAVLSDLWDVQYSAPEAAKKEVDRDGAAALRDSWVLIDGSSLGQGRLLEQVYVPPGRDPWRPGVDLEEAEESTLIVRYGDQAVVARAVRHRGPESCPGGCGSGRFLRGLVEPGCARREQQVRAHSRILACELQDLPAGPSRQARLASLAPRERSDLRQWLVKARRRWLALAAELAVLSEWGRRERLASLAVEERAGFRQWLLERKHRARTKARQGS